MLTKSREDNVLVLLDYYVDSNTQITGAFCVYTPLVEESLENVMFTHSLDSDAKVTLFANYLAGLAHLHGKGVMHRDINPKNLGVSLSNPVKGVLLDLDSALVSDKSDDHMQGTIPYLAPEVVALKDPEAPNAPPYTNSVDIWALGLSMFVLEKASHLPWAVRTRGQGQHVTEDAHSKLQDQLRERLLSSQDSTIRQCLRFVESMIAWEQTFRPNAGQLARGVAGISQRTEGSIVLKKGQKRSRE